MSAADVQRALLEAARLQPQDDVLVLGGGSLALAASEQVGDGWVYVVRPQVDELEELLAEAHAARASGVAYLVGAASVLPLPDGAVAAALGPLPLIAEDLGLITPRVEALREELGIPGMKVLQFAFADIPDSPYLPHNYERRCVAYTGTHDNDTTVGWFNSRSHKEQERVRRYLGGIDDIAWDLIRLLYESVADMVIVPLQDVLGLGTEARMNMPGEANGNWSWRVRQDQITSPHAEHLKEFAELYGREGRERMEGKEGM